jgi:ABC-type multidrug transport system fused ATPase/permease subunit
MSAMFYGGGWVIENSIDPNTGIPSRNPENVFAALFSMMFGASHAGTAQAFGPDIGRALAAATRIFKIVEFPSRINAVKIDSDTSKKRLSPQDIKGKIEFKDVWFRYPTRKEDFVLRGLNLIINPGETVALVGESGCGKSTFVSLLMRFYDVDCGKILLDGIDIRDINLHDLRTCISLVMQEPIIFNYTIRENILYGSVNLDSKNSEILEASKVANALEFIEQNEFISSTDETANSLYQSMIDQKIPLIELMGQEKYNEELDILMKMKIQESQKGDFEAIEGEIDIRDEKLKDVDLH